MIKKIALFLTIMLMISSSVFALDAHRGYNIPVDIDINGSFIKCAQKPFIDRGATYIPLRAFSDAIGGTIEWDETEKLATLKKADHVFSFYTEKNTCLIDGIEKDYSVILYKNLTFIPVRVVSEVLGYKVEWDEFYLSVKITAPDVTVPDSCVDKSYTYDDVLYLSKITHIESGYQHFDVKLGVAATVVNRVKSSLFPNSIKEVIFDTKYGVQFPPAHTDKINVTPSKESIIAAKCVLNGVNLVRNSLYFIDTEYAHLSWAHKNRPHYKNIYDMSFYE